jgi:hypothetical protein
MLKSFLGIYLIISAAVIAEGSEGTRSHALDGQAFALRTSHADVSVPDGLVFCNGAFTSGCIDGLIPDEPQKNGEVVTIQNSYSSRLEKGIRSFTAIQRMKSTQMPPEAADAWMTITYEGRITDNSIAGSLTWTCGGIHMQEPASFTGTRIPGTHMIKPVHFSEFTLNHVGKDKKDTLVSCGRMTLLFPDQDYRVRIRNLMQSFEAMEIESFRLKTSGSCPYFVDLSSGSLAIDFADDVLSFTTADRLIKLIDGKRVVIGEQEFALTEESSTIVIPSSGPASVRVSGP